MNTAVTFCIFFIYLAVSLPCPMKSNSSSLRRLRTGPSHAEDSSAHANIPSGVQTARPRIEGANYGDFAHSDRTPFRLPSQRTNPSLQGYQDIEQSQPFGSTGTYNNSLPLTSQPPLQGYGAFAPDLTSFGRPMPHELQNPWYSQTQGLDPSVGSSSSYSGIYSEYNDNHAGLIGAGTGPGIRFPYHQNTAWNTGGDAAQADVSSFVHINNTQTISDHSYYQASHRQGSIDFPAQASSSTPIDQVGTSSQYSSSHRRSRQPSHGRQMYPSYTHVTIEEDLPKDLVWPHRDNDEKTALAEIVNEKRGYLYDYSLPILERELTFSLEKALRSSNPTTVDLALQGLFNHTPSVLLPIWMNELTAEQCRVIVANMVHITRSSSEVIRNYLLQAQITPEHAKYLFFADINELLNFASRAGFQESEEWSSSGANKAYPWRVGLKDKEAFTVVNSLMTESGFGGSTVKNFLRRTYIMPGFGRQLLDAYLSHDHDKVKSLVFYMEHGKSEEEVQKEESAWTAQIQSRSPRKNNQSKGSQHWKEGLGQAEIIQVINIVTNGGYCDRGGSSAHRQLQQEHVSSKFGQVILQNQGQQRDALLYYLKYKVFPQGFDLNTLLL
jgi:hypothetical protein